MDRFPFGVGYFPISRSLPHEWEADLKRMKQVGIEEFNVHAVWRFLEPQEGEFDFETVDAVIEGAEREGMSVFFSVHPLPDPRWFHDAYAGEGMVDRRGRPAYPRNRVALCWDNPDFRTYCARFLDAVVRRYRAAAPVKYWNAWTEPNWIGGSPVYPSVDYDQVTCYCPHTAAKWQLWLREKYGSPAAATAAWRIGYGGGNFERWEDVAPPTAIPGQWGSYRAWLDWRSFMDDRLTDLVGWVADTIARNDPDHPTHTNVLFQSAIYNPTILGCDVFKMAASVDTLGASVYVRSTAGDRPELFAQTVDVIRSASGLLGRDCWVTEYQGGPVIWSHDRACVPSPQDLFLAPFQAIAHGAKGFYYWMWRPRVDAENGGWEQAEYGMVGKDGTLRDRAIRAGDASRLIRDNEDIILDAEYSPRVAILRSQELYHIAFGEVIDEIGVNRELPTGDPRRFYTDSVLGAYRMLWEEKIPVGFVTPVDITAGSLDAYDVLVMPFTYIVDADTGSRIADFVRRGGIVLADFGCAMKDEYGAVYPRSPGAGLLEVFGAEEYDVASDELVVHASVAGSDGATDEDLTTHMLRAILRPEDGAEVIGRFDDGEAAITLHRFGQGFAVLAGSLFFRGYQLASDPSTRRFVRAIVTLKGPVTPVAVWGLPDGPRTRVEASLLEGADASLLVVINHNDVPVQARIEVAGDRLSAYDLIAKQSVATVLTGVGLACPLDLSPRGVALLRLERSEGRGGGREVGGGVVRGLSRVIAPSSVAARKRLRPSQDNVTR